MVVKFICEYNGKNFKGFQSQGGKRTVQTELEKAFIAFFASQGLNVTESPAKIVVHGSGRTDAGVHARAQACHMILCSMPNTPHKILCAINNILPDDISIKSLEIAPDDFHARFLAREKTYLYRVYVSSHRSPLRDDTYLQIYKMPDIKKMQETAKQLFLGTHDFANFAVKDKTDKNTVRTITRFEIETHDDEIWFWITGNGFLHKQVRIMIGHLLYGNKKCVGAKGLTLWSVTY